MANAQGEAARRSVLADLSRHKASSRVGSILSLSFLVGLEKTVNEESKLVPTSLAEGKWPTEQPERCSVGAWIEFGRTLRGASDNEILSLIGAVETHLEEKLEDKTRFLNAEYKEYVREYAEVILESARTEIRKRNLNRLG